MGHHREQRTRSGHTPVEGPDPRRFLGYAARGVPFGPDDGTLAPWAVAASLPFAPEIVEPTLRSMMGPRIARVTNESRSRVQHRSDISPSGGQAHARLDLAQPLRARSRTGRPDARKLSFRVDLAPHAGLSICGEGPAACGLQSDCGSDQSGFSDFIQSISSGVIRGTRRMKRTSCHTCFSPAALRRQRSPAEMTRRFPQRCMTGEIIDCAAMPDDEIVVVGGGFALSAAGGIERHHPV